MNLMFSVATICVVTTTVSAAEPRTNAELIAAMGPTTESVMVFRVQELRDAQSPFLSYVPGVKEWQMHPGANTQLSDRIMPLAIAQSVQVIATGGSSFESYRGIGVGNYEERRIVNVSGTLQPVRHLLASNPPPPGLIDSAEFGAVRIYHTKELILMDDEDHRAEQSGKLRREDRFIAIIDDHTLAVTESRPMMEHIITSLTTGAHEVPAQWTAAADAMKLESPLVILRQFPRLNPADAESPRMLIEGREPDERCKLDSAAVTLNAANSREFSVHAITPDIEPAIRVFAYESFPLLKPKERAAREANGFRVVLIGDSDPEHSGEIFLQLLAFWGLRIAI